MKKAADEEGKRAIKIVIALIMLIPLVAALGGLARFVFSMMGTSR